ncbi:MAG: ImmA/IrrE family metallo-endopeptidase, partial [Armatimonadetes bacterium]|nr:ImmA/IrrE family metallo-endopeptidase [Armatimonadota bacterium]
MISDAARWAAAQALRVRDDAGERIGADTDAARVVAVALGLAGLTACAVAAADGLLAGADAVLDRQMQAVWFRSDVGDEDKTFLIAHELGHWWLHPDEAEFADAADDVQWGGLGSGSMQEVDGYSPAQRREVEATAFAAELLAPSALVLALFSDGKSAGEIADIIGVSERLVVRRLAATLLEGFAPACAESESTASEVALDPDQDRAARSAADATVVISGPGTGKTRALAGRALHLLGEGTDSDTILAVTFSRNAAEELRARLRASRVWGADRVQVYTLHGFGLEVLRRYGSHLGLPPSPTVVDAIAGATMIEEIVRDCELGDLDYPDAPLFPVPELLTAIARWKDQRITAEQARTLPDLPDAWREAARVYSEYERRLRDLGAVDFSDLIGLTTELLAADADVRLAVAGSVSHILVDELQDMDPSSLALLRLIGAGGATMWLVGDPLQSIYAFRGAGTGAVCGDDATADVLRLRRCYRCAPSVAALLGEVARMVEGAQPPDLVSCVGGGEATVVWATASDEAAQLDGIAECVRAASRSCTDFAGQAVLCRTNAQAHGVAEGLRNRGIPVAGPGRALSGAPVMAAIGSVARAAGLDADVRGTAGAVTAPDMRSAGTPGEILGRYLFGETGVARRFLGTGHEVDRAAMAWLWELAEATSWHTPSLASSDRSREPLASGRQRATATLLRNLRRALALGEDRVFGRASNSVAVMTIHASKGLEFDRVYVPFLNAGCFPPRGRTGALPAMPVCGVGDGVAADEARLLYVALSRAKHSITVSTCERLSGRKARPSPLWPALTEAVRAVGGVEMSWSGRCSAGVPPAAVRCSAPEPLAEPGDWTRSALDEWERCPKRFCFRQGHGSAREQCGDYGSFVAATRAALDTMRGHVGLDDAALARAAMD